jgi:hypothetical protein
MTKSIVKRRSQSLRYPVYTYHSRFTVTIDDLCMMSPNRRNISSMPLSQYSSGIEGQSQHSLMSVYHRSHIIEPLSASTVDYDDERNSIHCVATCDVIETYMQRVTLGIRRGNL